MSQTQPSISTIIATHNRPKLLLRALDCLENQIHRPTEVLVIDDGSRTNTREAIYEWKRQTSPNFSLIYLWQENLGPATARNRGLDNASGDLIHFLDDDDLLAAGALKYLANILNATDTAIATASYQHWKQEKPVGEVIYSSTMPPLDILESMIQGSWFIPIHGYLFTRQALNQIGYWNPSLTSQEDDELLLRAALASIPFMPAPNAYVYYCQHDGVRRATPDNPEEIEKRMYADLAIREFAFKALVAKGQLDLFQTAFALWYACNYPILNTVIT